MHRRRSSDNRHSKAPSFPSPGSEVLKFGSQKKWFSLSLEVQHVKSCVYLYEKR